MNIVLNGESIEIAAQTSLTALLTEQGLGERRIAVEVNGEIISRQQHTQYILKSNDRVEIVHALGGG